MRLSQAELSLYADLGGPVAKTLVREILALQKDLADVRQVAEARKQYVLNLVRAIAQGQAQEATRLLNEVKLP